MAIDLNVHKYHRIVPGRFKRATTGAVDMAKPDMDDRGSSGSDHEPIVGMIGAQTITVRLTRENIDTAAALFVTSSAPSVVTIASPAGGALPSTADMDIQITATAGSANLRTAKLEVRFGSATGPIVQQLAVWVLAPIIVNVCVHLCTISDAAGTSGATTVTTASAATMLNEVNKIWRPAGVLFVGILYRNTPITLSTPGTVAVNFGSAAAPTSTGVMIPANTWAEFTTTLGTNRFAAAANVYFVRALDNVATHATNAITYDKDATAQPGIVIHDAADANDLAHELGHFLDLDDHADEDPSAANLRSDSWSRRRLMHSFNPYGLAGDGTPTYQVDVGYGSYKRGAMLTMKDLSNDRTDGECTKARTRARRPPY